MNNLGLKKKERKKGNKIVKKKKKGKRRRLACDMAPRKGRDTDCQKRKIVCGGESRIGRVTYSHGHAHCLLSIYPTLPNMPLDPTLFPFTGFTGFLSPPPLFFFKKQPKNTTQTAVVVTIKQSFSVFKTLFLLLLLFHHRSF